MGHSKLRTAIPAAVMILLCTAGAANVQAQTVSSDSSRQFHLVKESFEFPGDGTRNDNRTIGDFCCTGETATVQSDSGAPLGFIYFYDFPGGGTKALDGTRSAASRFSVLVSGISDTSQSGSSPRVKSSIVFDAEELSKGSRKRVRAGALQFTVTIQAATLDPSSGRYLMDSVRCKVDVQAIRR